MAKKKTLSEKDYALLDFMEARDELERVTTMFGYATDEYFEVANMELTIATMKYQLAFKKLRMLCADGEYIPQMSAIYSYALA